MGSERLFLYEEALLSCVLVARTMLVIEETYPNEVVARAAAPGTPGRMVAVRGEARTVKSPQRI